MIQQVPNEIFQPGRFTLQRLHVLIALFRTASVQQAQIKFDVGKGRAKFIAGAGDRLVFQTIEFFLVRNIALNADLAHDGLIRSAQRRDSSSTFQDRGLW
jgi:hypothetical protein